MGLGMQLSEVTLRSISMDAALPRSTSLRSTSLRSTSLRSTSLRSTSLRSTSLRSTSLRPTSLRSTPSRNRDELPMGSITMDLASGMQPMGCSHWGIQPLGSSPWGYARRIRVDDLLWVVTSGSLDLRRDQCLCVVLSAGEAGGRMGHSEGPGAVVNFVSS